MSIMLLLCRVPALSYVKTYRKAKCVQGLIRCSLKFIPRELCFISYQIGSVNSLDRQVKKERNILVEYLKISPNAYCCKEMKRIVPSCAELQRNMKECYHYGKFCLTFSFYIL